MGDAVFADKTGAVDGEDHGQMLYGHVVDDVVVGTLEKA